MIRGCLETVVTRHRETEEKLEAFMFHHGVAPSDRCRVVERFVVEQRDMNDMRGKEHLFMSNGIVYRTQCLRCGAWEAEACDCRQGWSPRGEPVDGYVPGIGSHKLETEIRHLTEQL